MKKVRICFEVKGLGVDGSGAPAPAGMEFTIGEVPDDKYEEAMNSMKGLKAMEILRFLRLDSFASEHTESDFRLMSPEDYDQLYGNEEKGNTKSEED